MNVSTIADMIRADPTIPDDVPGFLKRVNSQDTKQVVTVKTVVEDVTRMVSIADMSGGPATERDVADALALLASLPLLDEARQRYDAVVAAVKAGDAQDSAALVDKFNTAVVAKG